MFVICSSKELDANPTEALAGPVTSFEVSEMLKSMSCLLSLSGP